MSVITDKNVNLVVVPTRIIEKIVESSQGLNVLDNFNELSAILNREELLFYKAVNLNAANIVPKQILEVLGYNNDRVQRDIFNKPEQGATTTDTLAKDCDAFMAANYPDGFTGVVNNKENKSWRYIAQSNSHDLLSHSVINDGNSYVVQFFAISPKTIGAMLIPTLTAKEALVDSVKGLIALLYDDYIANPDLVGDGVLLLPQAEKHNYLIRELSNSGLIAFYSSLLTNQ